MSSPFEAARAIARKTSLDDDKDPHGEERETKKPRRSPLFLSPMIRDSPWKALRLTPSKRTSEESSGNERGRPGIKFADLANQTHRKVFSTRLYVAKKLKRFQKDSPSSPLRRMGGFPRSNSSDVSVVDLCSSDEEENVAEQGKTPCVSLSERLMTNDDSLPKKGNASDHDMPVTEENCVVPPPTTIESNKKSSSEPQKSADCSLNGKRVSWKECAQQLQEHRSKMNNDKALSPTSKERENSYHSFVMGTFSIERKCLLLDVLAPASLSVEAMKTESWMSEKFDHSVVSKAFSERFGNLTTKDLGQLAKGDFLVPEGMVSVKETLRAHRLSRERAMTSLFPKKPSEPIPSVGAEQLHKEVESLNTTGGEEATGEKVQAANSNSFAWDGTFAVLPKDRAEENAPRDDNIPSLPKEDIFLPEEGSETQPTSESGALEDDENLKDDVFLDAVENHNENESDECLNHIERPQVEEEEVKDRDEAEAPFEDYHLKENENGSIVVCDGKTISDDETTNPSPNFIEVEELKKSSDNTHLNGPTEQVFIENSTSTQKYSFEDKNAGIEAGKESEDFVESSIVEYSSNESNIENRELQLSSFQEVRTIIGEVMKSIVDHATKHCEKKEEQGTEEIGDDNANNDSLKLKGPSGSECDDDAEEKAERNEKGGPLIVVSAKQLVLLALPLICLAVIVRRLGLFDVSNSIFEGCFRTFIQLHILGSLLSPIFKYGVERPGLVGCYALFMILLASYEASSRTKYTYDGQFTIIAESLVVNVAWVATWAFGVILKPRPVWNPRYLLPIVGMLLGNSINAISITMDTITTSLVEKQSEVDLYLSFGADQYEAVSSIVAHAIQKGATGFLNMMCVVGIVSIPGMMTGQILGGSSPMVAARYQAMIIFLIALTTLSTILVSSCLTVMSAFCSHQILRPDRFVKNRKRGLARLILWAWGYVFGSGKDMTSVSSNTISNVLLAEEGLDKAIHSPATSFEIRSLKRGSVVSNENGINSLIQASGLNRYFSTDHESEDRNRVLFSDLSFLVNEGDLLLVSGPSGTGKSQLLRMMAGLSPLQDGDLWLQGRSWKDGYSGNSSVEWRRQVRYVTQSKVQVPGTPLQFIKKIQSFRSWTTDNDRPEYDFMKHVSHHLRQWGMRLDSLKKEWAVLSGGESQRVLMAIALASRPKILLFDESTSALDHESKLAVETSIKDFVEDHEGGVMWVSHDEHQAERMAVH